MSDTPPNPPTPEVDDAIDAQGEQVTIRRKQGFWARLGGGGLMVSLMIHFFLVIVAVFWVISTWTDSTKHEPTQFATGAGGGNDGDRAKIYQHKLQQKNMKSLAKSTPRLTSKNPNSSISLPDIPNVSTSSMVSGATMGGSSKGFGGGSGGGIGSGQGIGVGNGKNMIGKFKPVMGAKIEATKIAVFMDASVSMKPWIKPVQDAIYAQFPDADIFCTSGAWINVKDGIIIGGSKYKGQPNNNTKPPAVATNVEKLSSTGKHLFKTYGLNFAYGSAGAWIDILRNQREYDALIIFSDFQDGITQYRSPKGDKSLDLHWKSDPRIYYDTYDAKHVRNTLPTDERTEQEKKWEADWIKTFSDAKIGKGPRLYIFSMELESQPILERCVEASGGQSKIIGADLKSGRNLSNTSDNEPTQIKKSSVSTPASTNR